MKLGISSHAFAWAIGVPGYPTPDHPLTAMQLLRRATELDVHVVQFADNLPLHTLPLTELEMLGRFAESSGIEIEIGTCGIEVANLRSYLRLAQRFKSPIVRTLLDTRNCEPTVEEVVTTLRRVLPEFEQAGVCLAIENHDRFPASVLAQIVSDLGSTCVGICLDTANSLGCGEGLETVVDHLAKWTVNLHVKDFHSTRLSHHKGFLVQGCPAGQGRLDIPSLLSKIRSRGRGANAIVELWVTPDEIMAETISKESFWATESIRYMRRFLVD